MNHLLEMLPMVGMSLLTVLLILAPIQIGQRLGIHTRKTSGEMQDAPIGSVVGASLGLLAFMLAFTFQLTANRYDARKQLLLDDVTAMMDVYLRAGLLPEPHRTECKKLLLEYVDLQAELSNDIGTLQRVLSHSQELHTALWAHAIALAEQDRSSEVYALFTSSLNELIDIHNQRVTVALHYRIHPAVMWVLYIIAFFSMVMLGFQFGISGKGNFTFQLALALVFTAVMWLVMALDNPEKGIIKVNQQPLFTLQKQLHENP